MSKSAKRAKPPRYQITYTAKSSEQCGELSDEYEEFPELKRGVEYALARDPKKGNRITDEYFYFQTEKFKYSKCPRICFTYSFNGLVVKIRNVIISPGRVAGS